MYNTIKKKIVAIIVVLVLGFYLVLSSHILISPVYSCLTQNPKLLYYAICWHLDNDSDKSFCGKINSVAAGIKGYASLHPLHPDYLGISKDDFRIYWIDLWGFVQRQLGIFYFPGMIQYNGHLMFIGSTSADIDKTPSTITVETYCKSLKEVYRYFREQNIEFLYIVFPIHLHQRTVLPYGIKDDLNQFSTDRVIGLKESDIPVIDARELYKDAPDVHYQLFYKGDHHWIPEYAYRVYIYISQELEKQHSPMAKYFDRTNMAWNDYYIEKRWPPFHDYLGSGVRRVGRLYLPQRDVAPYMIPRYETDYTFQVSSMDINKTGSVKDTFLEFYDNASIEIIINNRVKNKNKIFVFHDSFIHSFAPFLATNNHCLYMIDLRVFEGNITDLIEREKPDAVFFSYLRWVPYAHVEMLEKQIQEKQKLNDPQKKD